MQHPAQPGPRGLRRAAAGRAAADAHRRAHPYLNAAPWPNRHCLPVAARGTMLGGRGSGSSLPVTGALMRHRRHYGWILLAATLVAAPVGARTIYRCVRGDSVSLATAPEPGSRCKAREVPDEAAPLPN